MVDLAIWILLIISIVNVFLVFYSILRNSGIKTGGMEKILREESRNNRDDSSKNFRELREEIAGTQKNSIDSITKSVSELGNTQFRLLTSVEKRIQELMNSNDSRLSRLDDTLNTKIKSMQESNEKKLDQMRHTVDEKLQTTLERRLGESFKLVSDRLEAVQSGLGEMKNLASDVGSLQKVLTNVKVRGTWGEVQLGNLLEEILTPDQFARNIKPSSQSNDIVEFAIKLPGHGKNRKEHIWLPIDSKFPQDDYIRLQEASESGHDEDTKKAIEALIRSIKNSAKDISEKYIFPPHTTDFAILFLPTEGLYAEVLRQPGLMEQMQQSWRVVISGPTTLSAILNSLRMGFRTLAIEERSSEVWKTLAAVKSEFGKFGDVLDKVKRQLDTASHSIEQTGTRSRAIERKLQSVEELPQSEVSQVLDFPIEP